jgi:hypothetical protein
VDRAGFTRSNQTRRFPAIAQEHKRWPQLDFIRTPKPAATGIGNLDVAHAGVVGKSRRQEGLDGSAVPACGAAKFEHRGSSELIDFRARWSNRCICLIQRHMNAGCQAYVGADRISGCLRKEADSFRTVALRLPIALRGNPKLRRVVKDE